MKKGLLLFLFIALVTTGAFAQISFGGDFGVGMVIPSDDYGTDGLNTIGFPISVKAMYDLPMTIPVEGFGEAKVAAGFMTGYTINLFGVTDMFSVSSIPVLALAHLTVSPIYIDIAAGIHITSTAAQSDAYEGGTDWGIAAATEVGYAHPLTDNLTLQGGFRYSTLGYGENLFDLLHQIGLVAGVNYRL
ncbi:MAG: outer membrane beta-barrel protein [Spirochaetia bacterium]